MTEKFSETEQQKLARATSEIMKIFHREKIHPSDAAGIIGSILGVLASNTEDNYPFISLLSSFYLTYHKNYCGKATHPRSEPFNSSVK
jgi:hypothetical protein